MVCNSWRLILSIRKSKIISRNAYRGKTEHVCSNFRNSATNKQYLSPESNERNKTVKFTFHLSQSLFISLVYSQDAYKEILDAMRTWYIRPRIPIAIPRLSIELLNHSNIKHISVPIERPQNTKYKTNSEGNL